MKPQKEPLLPPMAYLGNIYMPPDSGYRPASSVTTIPYAEKIAAARNQLRIADGPACEMVIPEMENMALPTQAPIMRATQDISPIPFFLLSAICAGLEINVYAKFYRERTNESAGHQVVCVS